MNFEQNRHNVVGSNVTVSTLEWGSSVLTFEPPFDVILAADVVYIEEAFAELAQTLDDLSDPNSVIILCCKHRYERDDRFFQQLLDSGRFTDDVIKSWQGDIKIHKLQKVNLP
jgi:predicted nicotinamide N-methyase